MSKPLRNTPHANGITVFGIENHAVEKTVCVGIDVNNDDGGTYTFLTPEYAVQIGEAMIREAKATMAGERWKKPPKATAN